LVLCHRKYLLISICNMDINSITHVPENGNVSPDALLQFS